MVYVSAPSGRHTMNADSPPNGDYHDSCCDISVLSDWIVSIPQVYSGKVVSCSSEAVASQASNPLYIIARAVGLQRSAPPAAVHTLSVQASAWLVDSENRQASCGKILRCK